MGGGWCHCLAASMFAVVAGSASAQIPADKPVRIVIPYAPGASADLSVRLIGQKVEDQGGPRVLVESKPGGGGTVAAMTVKTAPPDSLSLFLADLGSFAINVTLLPDQPFDREKDFKPVTPLYVFPSLLWVPAKLPANSVAELVALAKQTQGGLSYGSQSFGAGAHLLGEMLAKASGAPLVHVPYRGAAPAMADLAAGNIAMLFGSFVSAQAAHQAKTVKVLAVASRQRSAVVPDAPTMPEAGYPDVVLDLWFGLVAQAAVPDATIRALNAMFVKAAHDPSVVDRLAAQGIGVMTSTPAEFAALIKADTERVTPLVRSLNIKAN